MKQITEKVETLVTRFEAVDGTKFATEEQCKEWEKSYECTVNAMWNDIEKASMTSYDMYSAGCEEEIYIVKAKSIDEVTAINAYLMVVSTNENGGFFTTESIGKEMVLMLDEGCQWHNLLGTKDEILANIINNFTKLSNKVNGITEEKEEVKTE